MGTAARTHPHGRTCVSISSFFSLMRDMPEKSMVSAGKGGGVLAERTPCRGPSRAEAKPGRHLGVFARPERHSAQVFSLPFPFKKTSPFSSICSCPDLVEATTLAAISLTLREHSWSRPRFLLLFSAFTCKEHGDGCRCPPWHLWNPAPPARGSPPGSHVLRESRDIPHTASEQSLDMKTWGWKGRTDRHLFLMTPSRPDMVTPARPFSPRTPNQLRSRLSPAHTAKQPRRRQSYFFEPCS